MATDKMLITFNAPKRKKNLCCYANEWLSHRVIIDFCCSTAQAQYTARLIWNWNDAVNVIMCLWMEFASDWIGQLSFTQLNEILQILVHLMTSFFLYAHIPIHRRESKNNEESCFFLLLSYDKKNTTDMTFDKSRCAKRQTTCVEQRTSIRVVKCYSNFLPRELKRSFSIKNQKEIYKKHSNNWNLCVKTAWWPN